MDRNFLQHYNDELHFIRHMGAEFAEANPKIARRLGLKELECVDPYVERLLEGFAFMAARVKHKIEARFPEFTQHLLELVLPHFLAPVPSMLIAQFEPDMQEPALAKGLVKVERRSTLRGIASGDQKTPVIFSTAHELTLWPIEITNARYLPTRAALSSKGVDVLRGARAGLSLRLRTASELAFEELNMDSLPLFLHGDGKVPFQLFEMLTGAERIGYYARPVGGVNPWWVWRDADHIQPKGFAETEALLPYTRRSFSGYRLLQEYFAFSERYRFVEFHGLRDAVKQCRGTELELLVLFQHGQRDLEATVDAGHFKLHCTPAVNLFTRRAAIPVNQQVHEQHVLPDRSRPLDYEVHSVLKVEGFSAGNESQRTFHPLFAPEQETLPGRGAFYTLRREPRNLSLREKQRGSRSQYLGSEVFITLADEGNSPYSRDLKQLRFNLLCTNRDLPLIGMTLGKGRTDFTLETNVPVSAIRCIVGPTTPKAPKYYGDEAWHLINHLSLNYLSLADGGQDEHLTFGDHTKGEPGFQGEDKAAAMLRKILHPYLSEGDKGLSHQVDAIRRVYARPEHKRLPGPGPITYVRGLGISLECDEHAFEGANFFLFGTVLKTFFTRYASLHSFVSVRLLSLQRGEIMQWEPTLGRQPVL